MTTPCTEKCAAMPQCSECGRRKAPRGRSVPLEAANGYCNFECPGYGAEPLSGHIWPEELEQVQPKGKR